MKAYKVFRWIWIASALTLVMLIMQACHGSPFELEMRRAIIKTAEPDTLVSEDLQFSGFDDGDWQYEDDYIP